MSPFVGDPHFFADCDAQAFSQMIEERTGDREGAVVDLRSGNKKNRHRESEGSRKTYSKKVFILSKNPSPSVSRETPLSLANSVSNSFCLTDSLVGT